MTYPLRNSAVAAVEGSKPCEEYQSCRITGQAIITG